jgi:hypothetical protein
VSSAERRRRTQDIARLKTALWRSAASKNINPLKAADASKLQKPLPKAIPPITRPTEQTNDTSGDRGNVIQEAYEITGTSPKS